jgi:hypothetical protein
MVKSNPNVWLRLTSWIKPCGSFFFFFFFFFWIEMESFIFSGQCTSSMRTGRRGWSLPNRTTIHYGSPHEHSMTYVDTKHHLGQFTTPELNGAFITKSRGNCRSRGPVTLRHGAGGALIGVAPWFCR